MRRPGSLIHLAVAASVTALLAGLVASVGSAITPTPAAAAGAEPLEATAWFTPIVPARLLDTRPGESTVDGAGRPGVPIGPGGRLDLRVVGRGGVPASGVAAVVLNVTATGPTEASFITVWPTGAARPEASNLNVVANQTVPNLVVAKVGSGGEVAIYNRAGNVHVIADVAGYFPTSDGFRPLVPARLLDTRPGLPTTDDQGRPGRPIGPGDTLDVTVVGRGGVPRTGVDAVVLNVTATGPTDASFITVWPSGTARPVASNLNTARGQTVPNLVVAKVGTNGRVSIYNRVGTVDVIADIAGWFPTGGTFVPLRPARVFETRPGEPVTTGGTNRGVGLGAEISVEFPVLGIGGVPLGGVSAVVLNVTAIGADAPSFLTVWPYGTQRPTASNLNVRGGNQTVPNLVVAKLGAGGKVALYNLAGNPHVAVDVAGYFISEPATTRMVDADERATCAVDVVGRLSCWGDLPQDDDAHMPPPNPPPLLHPEPLGMFDDAIDVAPGWIHTCALRTDGTVWCWGGGGAYPLIGDGTTQPRWPMVQVPGLADVVDIEGGYLHTCARRADGTVWCWGLEFDGGTQATPKRVRGLAGVVEVSIDYTGAACARRDDGRVLCWGSMGSSGVLGDGSGTDSATPRLVSGLTNATSIHVQSMRGCATRADSTAVCWGLGLLGDGTTDGSLTPVAVVDGFTGDPATGIVQVVGGQDWACALRTDAAVYCWGSRANGALGLGSSPFDTTTSITTAVSDLPPVERLSAGRFHLCAVATSGAVLCWGRNESGQVGDGTTDDRSTPSVVIPAP